MRDSKSTKTRLGGSADLGPSDPFSRASRGLSAYVGLICVPIAALFWWLSYFFIRENSKLISDGRPVHYGLWIVLAIIVAIAGVVSYFAVQLIRPEKTGRWLIPPVLIGSSALRLYAISFAGFGLAELATTSTYSSKNISKSVGISIFLIFLAARCWQLANRKSAKLKD